MPYSTTIEINQSFFHITNDKKENAMEFSFVNLLIAMAAGIFGVAIGGLASFIFVGFLVFIGAGVLAAGGPATFLGSVAFGAFGPHVGGWACGVAAAAYAGSRGKLATGRDVATAGMGMNDPMVLVIGVVFGAIGYVLNWLFNLVGFAWTDTVALTVVVSAIIARLAFGKCGVFGPLPAGQSRFARPRSGTEWLPYQCDLPQLILIGLGAGLLSAYIAKVIGPENGGNVIGFGISAASLIFLQVGFKIPVTHHITLCAAVATVASGSLIWGAAFGLLAAFVGEFFSRLFLIYGDTHIDPPACTICTLTSLSLVLSALGVYGALVLP
jgi:hypothetical protein